MSRRRRRPSADMTLTRRSIAAFEQQRERLLQLLPPEQPLACAKGCAHCCYQRVSVTPLELFELAAGLRRQLDAAALAELRERVRVSAAQVRGLSAAQHRGHRCPLNQADHSCAAYDSRPLLCRGANSFDADACARAGAAVPTYQQLAEAAQSAQEQLDRESARISGREQMLELACALSIALDDPEAEARWRGGEPVLDDAAHAWFEADELREWSRGS